MSATMPRLRSARIKRAASHRRATLRSRYKHKTHWMPVSANGSVVNICYSARYRSRTRHVSPFPTQQGKNKPQKMVDGGIAPILARVCT